MKLSLRLAVFLLIAFCGLTCSPVKKLSRGEPDHKTFIGTWVGDTYRNDMLVTWVQKRCADGKYSILFTYIDDNEVVGLTVENGKWWISDGRFYEQEERAAEPDTYDYLIEFDDCIFFRRISGRGVDGYEFRDYKLTKDFLLLTEE